MPLSDAWGVLENEDKSVSETEKDDSDLLEQKSDVFTQWRSLSERIKKKTLQKVRKQKALFMDDEVWLNEV